MNIAEKMLSKPVEGYDYSKPLYWLDFGNTQNSGQVILGTFGGIKQPQSKNTFRSASCPALRNASTSQKSIRENPARLVLLPKPLKNRIYSLTLPWQMSVQNYYGNCFARE
jgi:hypothetical protein